MVCFLPRWLMNKYEEKEDVSSYWTATRKRKHTGALKQEALDLGGNRLWTCRKAGYGRVVRQAMDVS